MIKEERRKKKKRKNILQVILGILIVLALAVLIIFTVFKVKNVEVEGNKLYDAKVIEKAVLNDEYSWNSLYVFLKYKFVNTSEVPFVDTMEISLKNPQTLHIKVYEKGIMGYLYLSSINKNVYFDKDGIVTELSDRVIEDTPQILGIDCKKVVQYEKLPIGSKRLKQLLTLTQSLKRNDLIPDSITYGVENEPVLTYGTVKVSMGSLEFLTQKVERLAKIKPQLQGMEGTLHLENWTEETTNIVFDKTESSKKDNKKSKAHITTFDDSLSIGNELQDFFDNDTFI